MSLAALITALATFFVGLHPVRAIERVIMIIRWEGRVEGAMYAFPAGILVGIVLCLVYFGVLGKRR